VHGVCLAGAGLAVREDGAVVPIDDLVEHGRNNVLVDEALVGFGAKDGVEGVCPSRRKLDHAERRRLGLCLHYNLLRLWPVGADYNGRAIADFFA